MLNIKMRNKETISFSFRRNVFFDMKKKLFPISKKLFLRDKEGTKLSSARKGSTL